MTEIVYANTVPSDFDKIKNVLDYFDSEFNVLLNQPSDGFRKNELNWRIKQLSHKRSRFIFEKYYVEKDISYELYQYCLENNYADKSLIAKWKKQGYEKLCCVECIDTNRTSFKRVCACRLVNPPENLQCHNCGCAGCSSNIRKY